MTPEEIFGKIEIVLGKVGQDIDNRTARSGASSRWPPPTCLDSFQETRDLQRRDREEWVTRMKECRAAQAENL